jgi:hypothetical protein
MYVSFTDGVLSLFPPNMRPKVEIRKRPDVHLFGYNFPLFPAKTALWPPCPLGVQPIRERAPDFVAKGMHIQLVAMSSISRHIQFAMRLESTSECEHPPTKEKS